MVEVLAMKHVMQNVGRRRDDSTITISWQPLAGDSIPARVRVAGVELEPRCVGCSVVFRQVGMTCQHQLELKTMGCETRVLAGRAAVAIIAWMPVQ